jgi:hypothetical protein
MIQAKPEDDIETLRRKVKEAGLFLKAVAEGYAAHGAEDRYACVENPEATPEGVALRGVGDFIVIDVADFLGLEVEDGDEPVEVSFP